MARRLVRADGRRSARAAARATGTPCSQCSAKLLGRRRWRWVQDLAIRALDAAQQVELAALEVFLEDPEARALADIEQRDHVVERLLDLDGGALVLAIERFVKRLQRLLV